MMYMLLKCLCTMPLTLAACEAFLLRAAKLVIIEELSVDDWVYLVHLVSYRATTRLSATDKEKAMVERAVRRIVREKDELGSMFN